MEDYEDYDEYMDETAMCDIHGGYVCEICGCHACIEDQVEERLYMYGEDDDEL